ncbi:putative 115 kDa protein in type-1 like protein [Argiope bruennichi]|uniref:Putative 115 kDa protein in type-1 like protein n=1 Tax=Argiope bruennichi TaxID=94029 RepID=A0A8T0EL23_ARGBR|nr:putative 115 kDa protein in type-1 like protein [Argiope bruennichi]
MHRKAGFLLSESLKNFHGLQRTKALENYSSSLDPLFTTAEIDGVINSLKLNKSPGPDCIQNETLKRIHLMFPCFFSKLFNACLQLSTFPRSWKRANIFLIPKNNDFRGPHLDNLRCISLLPTIGKCLEKLIVNRISWFLHSKKLLNETQFGFTPQKCCEDALLYLKDVVDKGKKKNMLTILIFLDIKGAFDHAWWPVILVLLKNFAIPSNIFHLVRDFLNDRSAFLTLGRVSVSRSLQRGCPQGSVSGPLLWNLIMNSLLARLSKITGCETIAFADDLLICFQGKCLDEFLNLLKAH